MGAAKRITDFEATAQTEGAASERRLTEQVRALSESIPDIVMQAAGGACRALLSDVAQPAAEHIAKVRSELHDSLAELATLTYRVGDEVELNGLQNLPALNGRRGSVVQLFPERARLGVQVDGHSEPKALRPCNLHRLHTPPAFERRITQRLDAGTELVQDTSLPTQWVAGTDLRV